MKSSTTAVLSTCRCMSPDPAYGNQSEEGSSHVASHGSISNTFSSALFFDNNRDFTHKLLCNTK